MTQKLVEAKAGQGSSLVAKGSVNLNEENPSPRLPLGTSLFRNSCGL
jgi:hypothetical protein